MEVSHDNEEKTGQEAGNRTETSIDAETRTALAILRAREFQRQEWPSLQKKATQFLRAITATRSSRHTQRQIIVFGSRWSAESDGGALT